MHLYWIVMLIAGIASGVLSATSDRAETVAAHAEVSAIAHNLLVYRKALANYAHTNTGAIGSVDDSALQLPVWFAHLTGVEGYVANGDSFTFYAHPTSDLTGTLVELTEGSVTVGYSAEGRLVNPNTGVTMIHLPSAIPNGATVLYQ